MTVYSISFQDSMPTAFVSIGYDKFFLAKKIKKKNLRTNFKFYLGGTISSTVMLL
jgi:hypothetical protein